MVQAEDAKWPQGQGARSRLVYRAQAYNYRRVPDAALTQVLYAPPKNAA